MSDLIEVETTIGNLFATVARLENHIFIENEEYFQNTPLLLMNEKSKWCAVTALLTKSDSIREIKWSNGSITRCADEHLFHVGVSYTRYAKDFHPGDELILANGISVLCMSNKTIYDNDIVYDLQIDTPSHLYQTADGIIHHNTLIAQSIAKQLSVPFAIADATSLTEAGLIQAPSY